MAHEAVEWKVIMNEELAHSIYGLVLFQRPVWQRCQTHSAADMFFTREPLDLEFNRRLCANQPVFNHLPASNLVRDILGLFDKMYRRIGRRAFRFFRVMYNLQRDAHRFEQHIQYLADQQNNMEFMELTDEVINAKITVQAPLRSVSGFNRPLSRSYGLAMEQEKENDKIWGQKSMSLKPLSILSVAKPPAFEKSIAKERRLFQDQIREERSFIQRTANITLPKQVTKLRKRVRLLPHPKKITKHYGVDAPDEIEFTPIENNTRNMWKVGFGTTWRRITDPELVLKRYEQPQFAIKECETPFSFMKRPITFRVFCLIRQTGDVFCYNQVLSSTVGFPDLMAALNIQQKQLRGLTVEADNNFLPEKQVTKLIQNAAGVKKNFEQLKERFNETIREFIYMYRMDIITAAPCVGCFELIAYDFQLEIIGESINHFLVNIETTPPLPLDNSAAWAFYPKLVDDMYALTIDPYFELQQSVYQTAYDLTRARVDEYANLLAAHKGTTKVAFDDEETLRLIPNEQRKPYGLRFSGGRNTNGFVQIVSRWDYAELLAKQKNV